MIQTGVGSRVNRRDSSFTPHKFELTGVGKSLTELEEASRNGRDISGLVREIDDSLRDYREKASGELPELYHELCDQYSALKGNIGAKNEMIVVEGLGIAEIGRTRRGYTPSDIQTAILQLREVDPDRAIDLVARCKENLLNSPIYHLIETATRTPSGDSIPKEKIGFVHLLTYYQLLPSDLPAAESFGKDFYDKWEKRLADR